MNTHQPWHKSKKWLAYGFTGVLALLLVGINGLVMVLTKDAALKPVPDELLIAIGGAITFGLPVLLHSQSKIDVERVKANGK